MTDLTNIPNWEGLAQFTIKNCPALIFWVRSNGTFAFVSQQMQTLLGYTQEEIYKLEVTDILLGYEEIDREKLRKRIDNVQTHIVRATLQKKNGSTISVESQNNSVQIGEEKFNVAFCRRLFDLTAIGETTSTNFHDSINREGSSLFDVCDELNIVGSSRALVDTLSLAYSYARNNRPILIRGETGVGKESLAHLIHRLSKLYAKPFERVNCSTITGELALSNLFGHVKGAFTGAVNNHEGIFARAEGGTVFLDEVGELPLPVQAMLLRVIQNKEYTKLGGSKLIKSNIRIIAATNRDLKLMVDEGTFREDLFHRLDILRLTLPPLRERAGDVPILVRHRLSFLNKTELLERKMPDKYGMKMLDEYHFPGNIRELFGIIERAYFDGSVGRLDITQELLQISNDMRSKGVKLLSYAENERHHILRVLVYCNWKIGGKGGASAILGLPRTTLISKIKRLGLEEPKAVTRRIGHPTK